MKRQAPPLRFLVLVVGGWICMRTAVHAPDWWVSESVAAPAPTRAAPTIRWEQRVQAAAGTATPAAPSAAMQSEPEKPSATDPGFRPSAPPLDVARPASPHTLGVAAAPAALPPAAPPFAERLGTPLASPPRPGRWTGSAWLFVRGDGAASLAQVGTLGGSQAGLRIGYRLNGDRRRPLALAARLYAPLGDRSAAEAALGLDWRPFARLPLHVSAERRQALGARGRSAFALSAHGGVDGVALPAGFRIDAYGQAGVVGTRSRDLFAEGAARVMRPVGQIEIGAGISGCAQPGAARLDAGPAISMRLPEARLRLTAEWRFRIAGDARPGSGPTLTVRSDF